MAETVNLYKCSGCGKVITDPNHGRVIHGNIYTADPENKGGLIGNNFPTTSEVDMFESVSESVQETAYCIPCFLNAVLPDHKLTTMR